MHAIFVVCSKLIFAWCVLFIHHLMVTFAVFRSTFFACYPFLSVYTVHWMCSYKICFIHSADSKHLYFEIAFVYVYLLCIRIGCCHFQIFCKQKYVYKMCKRLAFLVFTNLYFLVVRFIVFFHILIILHALMCFTFSVSLT